MLAITVFAGVSRGQTMAAKNHRVSAATTSDPCTSNLNSVCALVDSSVDSLVNADVLQLSQGALALDALPENEESPPVPPLLVSRSANASPARAHPGAGAAGIRPLASQPSHPVAVSPATLFPATTYDAEPDPLGLNQLRERNRWRASWRQRKQARRDQVDEGQTNSSRQLGISGFAEASGRVTKMPTQSQWAWPEHPRSSTRRRPRTGWKRTAEPGQSRATPWGSYVHPGP